MEATKKLFSATSLQEALLKQQQDLYLQNPYNYLSMLQDLSFSRNTDEDKYKYEDKDDIYTDGFYSNYLFNHIYNPSSNFSFSSKSSTNSGSKKLSEIEYEHVSGLSEDLLGFLELCKLYPDVASKIKITSGVRPGAKTKNGSKSFHATGDAIDIIPASGTFKELADSLMSHSDIVSYLKTHNLGILDETTSEAMAATGATGKHFHIGKDNSAKLGKYSLFKKYKIS